MCRLGLNLLWRFVFKESSFDLYFSVILYVKADKNGVTQRRFALKSLIQVLNIKA